MSTSFSLKYVVAVYKERLIVYHNIYCSYIPAIGNVTAIDVPCTRVPNPKELLNFSGPMTSIRRTAYTDIY